jgi:Rad3-related DNA helicase
MELDVTQMVMETKQAAGRLIRTMKDYGVVAILDRKITDEWKTARNTYAKILVHDLPFTQVTSDLAFVTKFLRQFQMKDRDGNK